MLKSLLIAVLALPVACGGGSHMAQDAGPDGAADGSADGSSACGSANAVQVSTGAQYSCARLADGTLRCWGGNFQAQLGDGLMQHQACDDPSGEPFDCSPRPVEVAGISDATELSTEFDTACALRGDGHVACWGLNDAGEVGVAPPTQEFTPVTVPMVANATAVAVGVSFACALSSDGQVSCWGANQAGQLGDGQADQNAHPSPVTVTGLAGVTTIAAAGIHACALLADHSVACWGGGDDGEIGDGSTTSTPAKVTGLANASAITVGEYHSCALRSDGTVWCWGGNADGEIGDGTGTNALVPVEVPGLTDVMAIAAGGAHTCAQESDGSLWCWGGLNEDQLPVGVTNPEELPVTHVSALDGVTSMGPSLQHDCFVAKNGSVQCAGRDDTGELGDGTVEPFGALTTVCW